MAIITIVDGVDYRTRRQPGGQLAPGARTEEWIGFGSLTRTGTARAWRWRVEVAPAGDVVARATGFASRKAAANWLVRQAMAVDEAAARWVARSTYGGQRGERWRQLARTHLTGGA